MIGGGGCLLSGRCSLADSVRGFLSEWILSEGYYYSLFVRTRSTCTGLQEKKRKIESTTMYKHTTHIH